jgi:predicted N-acetyltransferase YhbS
MHIRPLTPSDVAAARELMVLLASNASAAEIGERIARILETPGHVAMVAEQDEKVVGIVHAFERPALEKPFEIVVQALAVREDAQRGGVGRALMSAVEQWTRERGHGSMALHTRDARTFYERLDFDAVANPYFMRKPLRPS